MLALTYQCCKDKDRENAGFARITEASLLQSKGEWSRESASEAEVVAGSGGGSSGWL